MLLGIIICSISQTVFISYLVLMMNASNPAKYTSTIHFAIAILGFFVAVAGVCWGVGTINTSKRRLNGILCIVFSAVALVSFVTIMIIEYTRRLGIPLF